MIQKMIAQKIKIKNFPLSIITMGKIGIVAQNSIKFDTQRNKNKESKKAGVNKSEYILRVNASFYDIHHIVKAFQSLDEYEEQIFLCFRIKKKDNNMQQEQ